jgi:hypothetical protein
MPCTPIVGQRLAHFVELERLDDGGDHFHVAGAPAPIRAKAAAARRVFLLICGSEG